MTKNYKKRIDENILKLSNEQGLEPIMSPNLNVEKSWLRSRGSVNNKERIEQSLE